MCRLAAGEKFFCPIILAKKRLEWKRREAALFSRSYGAGDDQSATPKCDTGGSADAPTETDVQKHYFVVIVLSLDLSSCAGEGRNGLS
jgi:hypothetical protein